MHACCPIQCEAWKNKAPPTPPPAPTPQPMINVPVSSVNPAKPYMHSGKPRTKPFPDGVEYKLSLKERKAAARLHVKQDVQRITASRAAVAKTNLDVANDKLANA